jgi:cation-transporting ATPase E
VALNSPPQPGLTAAEVAERVRRGESNNFKARVGRSYWEIIRDNVLNLFNIVLGTLLIIVVIYGDYATALFAGFSLVTNSILGMYQELTAKRKLDQLAALATKEVRVWRDGQIASIPMEQIVKDDVIVIEPGDRIAVDGRIIKSDSLEIDESQLTGESDAVFKEIDSPVYSGSFCIAGSGQMVATQVGRNSTINKLSSVAKAYKNVRTPTQQRISSLVEITVIIMLIVGPMLLIAGYLHGQTWLEIIKNEVVFVSSIVPQGLVLVAILSLTLGAISISRFKTLVQRVNAVESMSNVSILCFDKTGTLTRNILAVKEIIPLQQQSEEELASLLAMYTGSLAALNRTAAAINDYCKTRANGVHAPQKVREIPFNSSRKWGAVIYPEETYFLGAPERVLAGSDQGAVSDAASLAAEGLRVLAFARSTLPMNGAQEIHQADPLALIVLSDEMRSDIQETLDAFREQHVALKVISGDNIETVRTIATNAGIVVRQAYTGDELEAMSEAEREAAVKEADLFARIEPDTKRKIIAALKRGGGYVAMVGDGVNDVPALKEAHLAIAMNDGAQISKDVADIVLLNNAMSTLPKAFEEGKIITQTIYATAKLFLTKNYYNIVLIFFVLMMTLPFPTSPIQISWITFGTVNIPATLIAFRLIKPSHMKTFRRDVLDYVLIAGTTGATNLAMLYVLTFFASDDMFAARSAVTLFIGLYGTLIFWNIHSVDILSTRSVLREWKITLLGGGLAVLTMIVPFLLPKVFDFVAPTPLIWVLIVTFFLLTALLNHLLLRNRHLINQLWELFKP